MELEVHMEIWIAMIRTGYGLHINMVQVLTFPKKITQSVPRNQSFQGPNVIGSHFFLKYI